MDEQTEDVTVEDILIEAGDALVAALEGGNTGVSQNAVDGWEAAKSQALASVVSGEFDGEPSTDSDDGSGQAADAPFNPTV